MKAVIIDKISKAEDVVLSEVEMPKVKPGWILVKVKGFGLNHSEQILRMSEINASYIKKPIIPGIECVGEVEDPSDSGLSKGQKIMALMGGMGRSFDGSYAEYALLPAKNVFPVRSDLEWPYLAAVPETYFTAWGSLFDCLHLEKEDTLLIRGATCALGYVGIQIGKALGCKVIATTHRESKLSLIIEADEQILDDGALEGKIKGVNKALDLIGPKYLRDTLRCVEKGGIVCQTGLLGGVYTLNGFDPIKDIPNSVYLTGFFSNYPSQETVDAIMSFLNDKKLTPKLGKVYPFENISEALYDMDNHKIDGKIVIEVNE